MAALPKRLRRLRLKQKAKRREHVPDTIPKNVSTHLGLVDPALERAHIDGIEKAAKWVEAQPASAREKARALAELGWQAAAADTVLARSLGERAVEKSDKEARAHYLLQLTDPANKRRTPDAHDLELIRKEFDLPDSVTVIACIGCDDQAGDGSTLSETVAGLLRDGTDSLLLMLGGDSTVTDAYRLSSRLPQQIKVRCLGMPLPSRWPSLIEVVDALIVGQIDENDQLLSRFVSEAAGLGKPPIRL